MGMNRIAVFDSGLVRPGRAGDGVLGHLDIVSNASAGNQNITIEQIKAGVAFFSGAAAAVNYTTPTAAAILAAFPELDVGDTYTFMLTNTAAQVATIVGGAGVTIGGFTTVNAGTRHCVMKRTGAATITLTSL